MEKYLSILLSISAGTGTAASCEVKCLREIEYQKGVLDSMSMSPSFSSSSSIVPVYRSIKGVLLEEPVSREDVPIAPGEACDTRHPSSSPG